MKLGLEDKDHAFCSMVKVFERTAGVIDGHVTVIHSRARNVGLMREIYGSPLDRIKTDVNWLKKKKLMSTANS